MPKIGAHVSAAVSLELGFERAQHIGAECFQFFVSPPQQWFQTKHGEEEIERFKNKALETQIGPNFAHATYLINLGTTNTEHLQKSIDWLKYGLHLADKLMIEGIVLHTGSHKGEGFDGILNQLTGSIKQILDSNYKTKLILETSAGAGGSIGKNFTELGQIIKAVNDSRLGVCMDTQHIFAAGYNFSSQKLLNHLLAEFEAEIGISNLTLIHANDSKTEFNSKRDRHENIGDGFIGRDSFKNLIQNPQLKNIPFILEVPGFSGNGPDQENIEILKNLGR